MRATVTMIATATIETAKLIFRPPGEESDKSDVETDTAPKDLSQSQAINWVKKVLVRTRGME